jgi:hypothetical protein
MLELQYPSPTLRKLKLHAQISSPASLVPLRPPICRGRNQHSWTIVFGTYLEVKMPEEWDRTRTLRCLGRRPASRKLGHSG